MSTELQHLGGVFTAKAVIFSSKNGQKTEHTLGTSEKTAKAVTEAAWEPAAFEAATGRKPDTEGELQKWIREAAQAYYKTTGKIKGLREWLTSLQEVQMDDKEMADFVQSSGTVDIPHKVNHATIRRLLGRVLIDRVEIKKNPGEFRNSREGFIRIVYRLGNQSRAWEDEWACFDVLKWSLRNWRNLYGVPLFVNGEPAGKVDYRNPALAE